MEKAFIFDLASRTAHDLQHVTELFRERQRFILSCPEKYGLTAKDGRLACGLSDELIILSATGFALEELKPAHLTLSEWHAFIQDIYYTAYGQLNFQFKPDATEVLLRIEREKCWIVTNSPDEKVKRRILEIAQYNSTPLAWLAQQVTGTAQKLLITDDHPLMVPIKTQIPGLNRDVFLRRGTYFNIVDHERIKRNACWDEVAVIGDIAELDLMMFAFLGAQVALVKGAHTALHEIAYIERLPNGQGMVIDKLTELI